MEYQQQEVNTYKECSTYTHAHDCGEHHGHHGHSGHHEHHHGSMTDSKGELKRAFLLGITLNLVYVIVEGAFGFISNSMGLLSDAGHNLSDVASLLIALIAFLVAHRKPSEYYTYGYRKSTVVASVVNAIILYVAVALILIESVRKLIHPEVVEGNVVAWVAGVGVVVNGITAWLFMKDSKHDLNIKGAFLHMAADTLVSVGVVVSGIIIYFTGWNIIDPIIGIAVAVMIAVTSWSLLHDSLRLAFDGVPSDIDMDKIKKAIAGLPEVESFHHLHVWALSTTETAMTVHVVLRNNEDLDKAILGVRDAVKPLGITHCTVEAETAGICDCHSLLCDSGR